MSPCRDSDVLHVVIPRGDTLRTCCNSERRYDTLHTARGTDETGIEGSERRDDVYYYNCQRLKLEGETENIQYVPLDEEAGSLERFGTYGHSLP